MNIDDIYPLVIVADRYGGCYSGGKYLAFNMYDALMKYNSRELYLEKFGDYPNEYYE